MPYAKQLFRARKWPVSRNNDHIDTPAVDPHNESVGFKQENCIFDLKTEKNLIGTTHFWPFLTQKLENFDLKNQKNKILTLKIKFRLILTLKILILTLKFYIWQILTFKQQNLTLKVNVRQVLT